MVSGSFEGCQDLVGELAQTRRHDSQVASGASAEQLRGNDRGFASGKTGNLARPLTMVGKRPSVDVSFAVNGWLGLPELSDNTDVPHWIGVC